MPRGEKRLHIRAWPSLALVVLLIAALGYAGFAYTRDAIIEYQWAMLEALADDKLGEASAWREEREYEALRFSETPGFTRAVVDRLRGADTSADPAWNLLVAEASIVMRRPHYESVFVLDTAGRAQVVLGAPPGGLEHLPVATERVRRSGRIEFHDFVRTGPGGQLEARFVMLAPLQQGGRFVGVLGFQLMPTRGFSPLVSGWPMLRSSAEVMVVRPEDNRVYFLTPRRFATGPAAILGPRDDLLAYQAAERRGRIEGVDYTGAPSMGVAASISGTPWMLITKVHQRENTVLALRFGAGVGLFSTLLLGATAVAVASWRRRVEADATARKMHAEAEKRAFAQHFDDLAKYANDIILLADADGRIREINDRAVEVYGYSREELLAMRIADLRTPAEREKLPALWGTLARARAVMFETVHRRKDGSTLAVESSARCIEAGEHVYYQEIVRDISERKRAEQRIRRLNRLYSMLVQTSEAIVHLRDEKALLEQACRIAVQTAGFDTAWIAMRSSDDSHLVPYAFHGQGEDAFRTQFRPPLSNVESGALLSARVVREGQPECVNDIAAEPQRHAWHQYSPQHSTGAVAALPLRVEERVVGVMGVYTSERLAFDEEILGVFGEMAADLGYALENISRENRRRDAERDLQESEFRFRSLFNSLNSGVLMMVPAAQGGFRVVDINPAFERLEHVERSGIIGRLMEEVFPWADHCLAPASARVWLSGEPEHIPAHEHRNAHPGWRESYVYRLPTEQLVLIMEDVTDRVSAVDALRQSEERLSLVLEGTEDGYWDVNLETRIAYYSRRFAQLLGYRQEEMSTDFAQWERLVHPDDLARVRAELERHLCGETPAFRSEHRMRRRDGGYIWMRARGRVVRRGPEGKPLRMAGTHTDITIQRQTEEQRHLWATVVDASQEVILVTDANRKTLEANPAYTAMTGHDRDEIRGRPPSVLSEEFYDPRFYARLWKAVKQTGHWEGELRDRRKNGDVYPVWLNLSSIKDKSGRIKNYVLIASDISERKAAEERIRYLAYHDALTGLPNRVLFQDRVKNALAHAQRAGAQFAVMFLDLDRFKNVNDSLGHALGDRLLVETAKRLRKAIRQDDTVSRQGGDEFLLLLSSIRSPADAAHVAEKAMTAVAEPFPLDGTEVQITASVGIAVYPEDGDTEDVLIRNADAAMYFAKERGRANMQFFVRELNRRVLARLSLESELRRATERQEFVLHYQPQINVRTGALVGVEALIRWRRGTGLLQPEGFIHLAEETGLIVPIGVWVMEEACRQQQAWIDGGLPSIPVSINVSSVQLREKNWRQRFSDVLERNRTAPGALEVELTEGSIMQEAEASVAKLNDMKAMGISLAIDDFGTGYSSLSYLRRFPIDRLKVDKSFVHDLEHDEADRAVTQAIIALARSLGIRVIAEGVEHPGEIELLRERQCDEVQGFIFAPPLPPEVFVSWLQARG
jgi:diguanylate cyclase (GGDEF)-like protein/PAS domain S-box-containing protein